MLDGAFFTKSPIALLDLFEDVVEFGTGSLVKRLRSLIRNSRGFNRPSDFAGTYWTIALFWIVTIINFQAFVKLVTAILTFKRVVHLYLFSEC